MFSSHFALSQKYQKGLNNASKRYEEMKKQSIFLKHGEGLLNIFVPLSIGVKH